MKKSKLIEELGEAGLIDKNFSIGAKHSKLKGLLNSISIAGSDNPLIEIAYKGMQCYSKLEYTGCSLMW